MKQEKLVAVTRECWHLLRRYHEEVFREKVPTHRIVIHAAAGGGGEGSLKGQLFEYIVVEG